MKTWKVEVCDRFGRWHDWLVVQAPTEDAAILLVRDACPERRLRAVLVGNWRI
jgi:hypothetical protein